MHDDLTKQDIAKMQAELDERNRLMPELIEEVKRTRAFGDLSENFEYKEAKRAKNRNGSRIPGREAQGEKYTASNRTSKPTTTTANAAASAMSLLFCRFTVFSA